MTQTYTGWGVIRRQGITTYQYGAFVMRHPVDETIVYALRDGQATLEEWVGQQVYIKGCAIEGYPIEGGPLFLEVNFCSDAAEGMDDVPDCQ